MVCSHSPRATRRSTFSRLRLLAAAVALTVAAMLPHAALAADRDSVERGRAAARGILLLRDPRACGIALLRARCKSDAEQFLNGRGDADFQKVPKIGPHPASGLITFVTDGDREAFDFALQWFNNTQSTSVMWGADPRDAALYDAGIEDVFLPAAPRNGPVGVPPEILENLALVPVGDLANHVASIPSGTLPLDVAPIRAGAQGPNGVVRLPPGARAFAHDLVAALDTAVPPPPLATITYPDGAVGDARFGIVVATVMELIDSPDWLAQADAQRFVDDYLDRMRILAPDRADEIASLRPQLRGDRSYDHDAAGRANSALVGEIVKAQSARGKRIAVAMAATQMTYSASILRDQPSAGELAKVLAASDELDAIPGFQSARIAAGAVAPSDWAAHYRMGVRFVDLIMKGGSN